MPQIIVHLAPTVDKEIDDLKTKFKLTSKADVVQELILESLKREREKEVHPTKEEADKSPAASEENNTQEGETKPESDNSNVIPSNP